MKSGKGSQTKRTRREAKSPGKIRQDRKAFQAGKTKTGRELSNPESLRKFSNLKLEKSREKTSSRAARRRWVEHLLKSERGFVAAALDILACLAVVLDRNGRIILFNRECEKVIGYSFEEVKNRCVWNFLIAAEERDAVKQIFRTINRGMSPNSYENYWVAKNGTRRLISWSHTAIADENGAVEYIIATGIDITEHKQNEMALASEREKLAVTLRSIGDGVITTDTKGRVVLLNQVAEKLTGWPQEDAVGRPLVEVFNIVNEKTQQPCANPVEKVLKSGKAASLANHTLLIARDGTERIIADSAAAIHDPNSKVHGVVLVFRDITDKQRIDQELQRTEKLESLSILAGGIAHDFNNLLTAVLGNISFAKMLSNPKSEMFESLEEAEEAVLRAKDLTQQLLTFSRGGLPIKKTASIADLVKDSASFVLRGSKAKAQFHFPEELWPVEVDEGQMHQVIQNMFINADQAMPEGGVIKISVENAFINAEQGLPIAPGNYIKLSIKDQGEGIPEEYRSKIFDPFFTTKEKGSGLGLAVCHSIIKKHNGHISLESEPGAGTTFHIYLPAAEKTIPAKEESGSVSISGKGRILVMDDEKSVRDTAGRMLKGIGYDVTFAKDGNEAIQLFFQAQEQGQPFDTIIMDLTIPGGMGGKNAVKKLLSLDPKIKVIVSSGYSNDPVMAEFKKYGFAGVITKPYAIKELSRVLHKVLKTEQD